MILSANKKNCLEVLNAFFRQLWTMKKYTIIGWFLFSLLTTILIGLFGITTCGFLKEIINANTAILGIDIAAFAILFAALQGKKLDNKAKKAFDEQSITVLGNAFFQLLAILLSISYALFTIPFLFWVSLCCQIFALINVFDIIFELYTLTTLVNNKQALVNNKQALVNNKQAFMSR